MLLPNEAEYLTRCLDTDTRTFSKPEPAVVGSLRRATCREHCLSVSLYSGVFTTFAGLCCFGVGILTMIWSTQVRLSSTHIMILKNMASLLELPSLQLQSPSSHAHSAFPSSSSMIIYTRYANWIWSVPPGECHFGYIHIRDSAEWQPFGLFPK